MKQPPTDTALWFAVYTRSRSEKVVRKALEQQGVVHFLPTLSRLHLHGTRRRSVELPLVPGYIFVFIALRDYSKVLQTTHVVDFVRFGRELIPIPQREIDIMEQVCTAGEHDILVDSGTYRHGDLVEVTEGPLKGITGRLTAVQGRKNLIIELKNVGRSLRVVQLETKYLRKLSKAESGAPE